MNKKTTALTADQYHDIMDAMQTGGDGYQPNPTIAMALKLEANLGLRLSDIVPYSGHHGLRLSDIRRDGSRYHLEIKEIKTGKPRTFTVPQQLYDYIKAYCQQYSIDPKAPICPISERRVQKYLQTVCEDLGGEDMDNISTHSFRKFYATSIYNESGYNIALVQKLLQHSSPATTQRYIGISEAAVEDAISKHLCL